MFCIWVVSGPGSLPSIAGSGSARAYHTFFHFDRFHQSIDPGKRGWAVESYHHMAVSSVCFDPFLGGFPAPSRYLLYFLFFFFYLGYLYLGYLYLGLHGSVSSWITWGSFFLVIYLGQGRVISLENFHFAFFLILSFGCALSNKIVASEEKGEGNRRRGPRFLVCSFNVMFHLL